MKRFFTALFLGGLFLLPFFGFHIAIIGCHFGLRKTGGTEGVGLSTTRSPEHPFTHSSGGPDNTTLRLADSVNVFEAGALAPGVTVGRVDYQVLAFDAGVKYKGLFLQAEYYNRWLDNFQADGPRAIRSSTPVRAGAQG